MTGLGPTMFTFYSSRILHPSNPDLVCAPNRRSSSPSSFPPPSKLHLPNDTCPSVSLERTGDRGIGKSFYLPVIKNKFTIFKIVASARSTVGAVETVRSLQPIPISLAVVPGRDAPDELGRRQRSIYGFSPVCLA